MEGNTRDSVKYLAKAKGPFITTHISFFISCMTASQIIWCCIFIYGQNLPNMILTLSRSVGNLFILCTIVSMVNAIQMDADIFQN